MEAPFDWPISPRLLPIGAPLGSSSINISKAPRSLVLLGPKCVPLRGARLPHSHGSTGNLFGAHAGSGTVWCSNTLSLGGTALSRWAVTAAQKRHL